MDRDMYLPMDLQLTKGLDLQLTEDSTLLPHLTYSQNGTSEFTTYDQASSSSHPLANPSGQQGIGSQRSLASPQEQLRPTSVADSGDAGSSPSQHASFDPRPSLSLYSYHSSTSSHPVMSPLGQHESSSQSSLASPQDPLCPTSVAESGNASDSPSQRASFNPRLSLSLYSCHSSGSHTSTESSEISLVSTRSNSNESELSAEMRLRRREQNRAAQRAFRERKEQRIKDLRSSISNLENSSNSLVQENVRIKHALEQVTAENEILRTSPTEFCGSKSAIMSPEEHEVESTLPMSPLGRYTDVTFDNDVSAGSAIAAAQSFLAGDDRS